MGILQLTCWVVLPGFVAALPAPGMLRDVATAGLPHYPVIPPPASVAPYAKHGHRVLSCPTQGRRRLPLSACRLDSSAPPPAGPSLGRALTLAQGARRRPRRDRCDGGDHDHRAEGIEAVGRDPVNPSSTGASACNKVIASAISPPRVLRASNWPIKWPWRRVEARGMRLRSTRELDKS